MVLEAEPLPPFVAETIVSGWLLLQRQTVVVEEGVPGAEEHVQSFAVWPLPLHAPLLRCHS